MNNDQVSHQIQEMIAKLTQFREKIQMHQNEQGNDSYKKNIELVEQSKKQLHHIVMTYFKELQSVFIFLRRFYPSKDIQSFMIQEIDRAFSELSLFQKKIDDKTFTHNDLEEFQQLNYNQKQSDFQIEADALHVNKFPQHTTTDMPYVRINDSIPDSLYFGLNQYASVYWPGIKGKQDKLSINRENMFVGQTICLPFIKDNKINLFDIPTQKAFQAKLSENIEEEASYVSFPNGNIFVSGGVDYQGFILGSTQIIDVIKPEVFSKQDMLVKRVAHTLVYVPPLKFHPTAPQGYVYAIGGRTHNSFRTTLCERYNIETEKWEQIPKLEEARSRSACAYAAEQHCIYVFFGTNSQQQNNISCEKYDLLAGQWRQFNISNYLAGFDVSWGQAISINEEQILIFGGLRDSKFVPYPLNLSRKLIVYNISNDSITVQDTQLPVDFLPLNAAIHNNQVYSVGRYLSCNQAPPNQTLGEGAFVIEIGQQNSICCFIE